MEAALEMGLDRFTMHAVAAQLGVTPPALYSHVSSREELLGLVAERLFEQIEASLGDERDWRSWLGAFARAVHDELGGSRLSIVAELDAVIAAVKVRVAEHGLGLLAEAGFSPDDAARAMWLVFRTAATAGTPEPAIQHQQQLDADLIGQEEHPNLVRVAAATNHEDMADTFEADLDIVLDGLDALLQRTRAVS